MGARTSAELEGKGSSPSIPNKVIVEENGTVVQEKELAQKKVVLCKDNQTISEHNVIVIGNHLRVYGAYCVVIGQHNTVHGTGCLVFGQHAQMYGVQGTLFGSHSLINGSTIEQQTPTEIKSTLARLNIFSLLKPHEYISCMEVLSDDKQLDSENVLFQVFQNIQQLDNKSSHKKREFVYEKTTPTSFKKTNRSRSPYMTRSKTKLLHNDTTPLHMNALPKFALALGQSQ